MELMDIYNKTTNPLDDPQIMNTLLDAYSKCHNSSFYKNITRTVDKDVVGRYRVRDFNAYNALIFNKWKNSIVNLTREEFIELYKRGEYKEDLITLREYLKTVPDVTDITQVKEILYGSKNDEKLERAMDRYRYTRFGEGTGWNHICSRYLTAKKDQFPNIEHRLYLNTECLDIYTVVTLFMKKCEERHIPYYYKFDIEGARDDTIVIYSSTEQLQNYIEVLKEIKREYPDLISRSKQPPLLTAKIDNWIGYGSEPDRDENGKLHSFNEIRSNLLYESIDTTTKGWIHSHKNMNVNYGNTKMTFQDYVARKIRQCLQEEIVKRFNYEMKEEEKRAKREKRSYNEANVSSYLGYTREDLTTDGMKEYLDRVTKKYTSEKFEDICSTGITLDTATINVRNGKTIKLDNSLIQKAIQQISLEIRQNDPSFMKNINKTIRQRAPLYGVDPNNFSFDIKARNKIYDYELRKKQAQANINNQNDRKQQLNSMFEDTKVVKSNSGRTI